MIRKTLLAIACGGFLLGAQAQSLQEIVDARPAEMKQRDNQRNPIETLTFFDVQPGMTVAEALPGGGWYTRIIAPLVGSEGTMYGINYNDDMWARFGFFTEEAIKDQIERTTQFPGMVAEITENAPAAEGFTFATVPDSAKGTADRILFIRALHNLNRFEEEAQTMTNALTAAHMLLKEDGKIGVVQHRAPESANDAWANGSAGYLKQSTVISLFEKAGFKLVAKSEVNANENDNPTEADIVWRLPPTYFGAGDDADKRAAADAIGESDRMTLLFEKQ
ncbi:methyltransferase [Alteromonas sp. ASW11-36]|uniref:Methyltransferase n=1 Tax=Alteromonas arenosi TaxID=3055817 RepID=A0ABT7SWQ3_9ALTE|nr:methyltransferase [Alteromonas sp. ASW11-36]MDM7860618.1 methyltransferase [Alteromonas sp. ASW11-36]